MSKTKAELEKIFDGLYDEAEAILKEFNFCDHKVIKGEHSCIGSRVEFSNNAGPQCCCAGCKNWTNKGCVAHKPLTCRTWICVAAQLKNNLNFNKSYQKLQKVKDKVLQHGFYVHRGDKEASIKQALTPERITCNL